MFFKLRERHCKFLELALINNIIKKISLIFKNGTSCQYYGVFISFVRHLFYDLAAKGSDPNVGGWRNRPKLMERTEGMNFKSCCPSAFLFKAQLFTGFNPRVV